VSRGAGRAAQLAEHAARLVGTDARPGRRAAQQAIAVARAGRDGRSAALALRAHGRAALELGRPDERPGRSALTMSDGPLTAYDLERLSRAPQLVLLPACQSGAGAVQAGDEVMGLTSALFALGLVPPWPR
jgi:CHAT domain-containing protein